MKRNWVIDWLTFICTSKHLYKDWHTLLYNNSMSPAVSARQLLCIEILEGMSPRKQSATSEETAKGHHSS